MKPFELKKCKTCPYKLGLIKCIKSPCPECLLSKRKTHPFDFDTKIVEKNKN